MNFTSNRDRSLSLLLRQSLTDVLSEVSDDSAPFPAPPLTATTSRVVSPPEQNSNNFRIASMASLFPPALSSSTSLASTDIQGVRANTMLGPPTLSASTSLSSVRPQGLRPTELLRVSSEDFCQPQMEFATQGSVASKRDSSLGLLTAPMSRTSFALSSTQVRPSEALGMTSQELLLAAAAEKRIVSEQNVAAAIVRQRALRRSFQMQHPSASLLGLFQSGIGSQDVPFAHDTGLMMPHGEQAKEQLRELGSSLREKSSPYIDVSGAADPDPNDSRVKKTRGGVTEPFPERLHRLLKEIADDGNGDVISFLPHGRAFAIHKPDKFVSDILPGFFKMSQLSSFQRQLNLYGFKRLTSGRDAGAYYHELFLQGRPNMCLLMRRVGLPKGNDRRKTRAKTAIQVDPDFYSMKPVVVMG